MRTGIFRAGRWVAVTLLGACGIFAVVFLVALQGVFGDQCWIAARFEVVDELREGDRTLYLVYRVTGFADKAEFYSLYAALPSLDNCDYPKDEPLDEKVIELDEGRMVKDVIVRGTTLEIRYTRQTGEGVQPAQAKLSREEQPQPTP